MNDTQIINYPKLISITITNSCNLRCRMCGQWGVEGYMKKRGDGKDCLSIDIWKKMIDEIPAGESTLILLRGGEPFLYPGIMGLIACLKEKNLFLMIDTNGTLFEKFADDIVMSGINHLTLSIDGPEKIHDDVRGTEGTFKKIARGVAKIQNLMAAHGRDVSISINCTISSHSYMGLGDMPDVARSLNISTISIVPYYYFNNGVGMAYEKVMSEEFGCKAYSWQGFHNESSGVDTDEFIKQYRRFNTELKDVMLYPYMDISEDHYATWFSDCTTETDNFECMNPWRLIDIQPNGDVNFCVDFPDFVIGNIQNQSIEEIWKGDRANMFREYLKKQPLPICARCGAKYMSKM